MLNHENDPNEVLSTRVLPAPRETVYAAFADPAQLVLFWGPKGFTNTFHEFDLRPGGRWRFVMHAPDGSDHENVKDFVEVVAGERIVFRHPQVGHDFTMTILFADEDPGTRITWRMRFDDAAELARIRSFVEVANEENLDRLEAHLAARRG